MNLLNRSILFLFLSILICTCKTTERVKIEDFKVNINSPKISIGQIEIQFEQILGLGSLKKQTVNVFYYPKEDAVCLTFWYEFYTYNQFWDRRGRSMFINALQKYNEDYEARNLLRNPNKSLQKYGTIRGYLVWQQLAFTVQASANMNVDLGYTFKDRSPYFSVFQRDAEYIDETAKDNSRTSPYITMYFTRAQAAELAEIFEQYMLPNTDFQDDYKEPPMPPAKKDEVPRDIY